MNPDQNTLNQEPEITYYSGILYHGAKTPVEFNKKFKYSEQAVIYDGSFTLGEGLYFTNNFEAAKDYSEVRQHSEADPIVYSAYMPDCKFLDFRGEHDNLQVTKEFTIKWKDFFKEYLEDLERISPITEPEYVDVVQNGIGRRRFNRVYSERRKLQSYLDYLNSLVDKNLSVDLRVLFGSVPKREIPANDSNYEGGDYAPEWSNLFKEFMISKLGVDGVIYNETSEKVDTEKNTTFVVYNLDKVNFSEKPME